MPKLEFKFDPSLDYQLEAIRSVIDVFKGLPDLDMRGAWGSAIVPNLPPYQSLDESWLHGNVLAVQNRNDVGRRLLERAQQLQVDEGLVLKRVGNDSWRYPSFTVEMETGTGKTYVYLRTIYELHEKYGFRKFVIVVPSVAIYEGVVKNFQVTRTHFAALYGNPTVNLIQYDSDHLGALRNFAISTNIEILVMTIQSFRLARNKIYRASEQLPGAMLPHEYIQETRPILILDEPQNMETTRARSSLRTLHPLFALRYSATHRTTPNHLYSLTPFEAFRRGLVKKVQVDAVTERNNFNRPFLSLDSIKRQHGIRAAVRTYIQDPGRVVEDTVTLRDGEDLHEKTGREEHESGYVVEEISVKPAYVRFANGIRLHLNEAIGPARLDIFRVQIERTVLEHMRRQQEMLDDGIKVLSLFFIDRVANYVDVDGIIKRLFDEAFEKHKHRFVYFRDKSADEVREGYFAARRTRDGIEYIDKVATTKAERAAEKEAYELIMKEKERLLSFEESVSFVFAHSALKEGWDNPNVFQICTLNQTVSKMKKRQEIGRGLRIPVDQTGERIFDEDVTILTVVANESYQEYVEDLQKEYAEDGYTQLPPKPSKKGKATAVRNDRVFSDARFRDFWQQLVQRTSYHIHIDTPELIQECVDRLNNASFPQPIIVIERGEYVVTEYTFLLESVKKSRAKIRLRITNTRGMEQVLVNLYESRDDFEKILDDPRLRGFRIDSIHSGEPDSLSKVVFDNGEELLVGGPYSFQSQAGQRTRQEQAGVASTNYPVFNLLDRAARATDLTRPTLNAVFRRMRDDKKEMLFKNPEGFAEVFISQVRQALADHIVDNIRFTLTEHLVPYDLEAMFPPQKEYPQSELVPADEDGLYDFMQVDSGVEKNFVQMRLVPDGKTIAYFKFPPKFKISFPRILGNYNPDWGILRYNEVGETVLQLVRETKGTEDLAALQFSHERRKIKAAEKHFREVGIEYRVVTDETEEWWRTPPEQENMGL